MVTRLFNQHPSGLHHLRSVYLQGVPSFLETGKKVPLCHVRIVRRMLEDVPMEFLMQQGLYLPGSMRICIVVQQNNSTRELASSATQPKISSSCRQRITPRISQPRRDSQSAQSWSQLPLHLSRDKVRRTTA